ncbi:MAG: TrkA C-terminal domain-containing protein [Oscillospiraceae bacterium]|jgi:hypothetical protein|nr:TrkA C-terminal domain-containing protein [Oscillospiraceae bacterium]
MNIYTSASLFAVVVMLYWVISEVFTVLFRLIGLPEEKARFQVTSLLTGCGFTTRESEMFLSNRSRRRLATIAMLFGFVFNITIVSVLINVFMSLKAAQLGSTFFGILVPLAAVAAVLTLSRTRKVRRWLDMHIEQAANRVAGDRTLNSILLIDQIAKYCIAQVTLNTVPEEYRGKPLSETGLKQERNILVLLVERKDAKPTSVGAGTVLLPGDRITVFGNYVSVCEAFHAKERFAGR